MSIADEQRTAVAKWRAAMEANAVGVQSTYGQGTHSTASLLADAEKWGRFATAGRDLNDKRFYNVEQSINGVAAYLKGHPGKVYDYTHTMVQTLAKNIVDAIYIFIEVGRPKLLLVAKTNAAIDKVVNAPSTLIAWTLEQTLAAIGLPKGVLPVIGGVAVIGLGAWAYFTFLAPVSRVSRRIA